MAHTKRLTVTFECFEDLDYDGFVWWLWFVRWLSRSIFGVFLCGRENHVKFDGITTHLHHFIRNKNKNTN